jgi:hypothetical protein
MTNVASSLLDFILDLFRDPEAAAAFREDPQQALADAGLADVSPDEVHDLMPMVAAYSPGHWNAAPRPDHHPEPDHCDDDDRPAGKPVDDHHDDDDPAVAPAGHHDHHPVKPVDHCDDDGDKPHHHAPAAGAETTVIAHVQNIQVTHVENTFTYVDVDIDASHGIWASGDADVIFGGDGDDAIVAGDGIALGEDAELDNEDGEIAIGNTTTVIKDNTVIDDSVIIKDNNVAVGTEGPVAQDGSTVDSHDTDTDIEVGPILVESGSGSIVGGDQVGSENDGEGQTSVGGVGNAVGDHADAGIEDVYVGNEASGDGSSVGGDGEYDYDDESSTVGDITTGPIQVGDGNVGGDDDESSTVGDITTGPIQVGDGNVGDDYEPEFEYAPEVTFEDDVVVVDVELESAPA